MTNPKRIEIKRVLDSCLFISILYQNAFLIVPIRKLDPNLMLDNQALDLEKKLTGFSECSRTS